MNLKKNIAMLLLAASTLTVNAHVLPDQDQTSGPNLDPTVVTYSAVPEARTVLVGAVLLMPLGVSLIRNMRRNKKSAV
jgi:hypothetical protein